MPQSTFSKRWRLLCPKRKWPFRTLTKIMKDSAILFRNMENMQPAERKKAEEKLMQMCKTYEEESKPVIISIE